jgi:hypothetical protein
MQNQVSHDEIIAKIQHFSDKLSTITREKETLSIILGKCDLQPEIRNEILIYKEILDEYHTVFQDIIIKD